MLTRDRPRGARRAPASGRAAGRPAVARGNGPGLRRALCRPGPQGARRAGPGGRGAAARAGRGAARARGRRGAPGAAAAEPAGKAARVGRGSPRAAVSGVSAGPGARAAVRGLGAGAGALGHGVLGKEWARRPRPGSRGPARRRAVGGHTDPPWQSEVPKS